MKNNNQKILILRPLTKEEVKSIRDSNIRQQATRGARMLKQAMVAQPEAMMYDSAPMAASRPAPSTPSFDEVKYEANLSVDFKIAP